MKNLLSFLCIFIMFFANTIKAEELVFNDKNGENKIKFQTKKISKTNGVNFFASNVINGEQVWKMHDFIQECEFDLAYKKNKIELTDLDKDGIKEVWLIYYMNCSSDLSPSTLKILTYEYKNNKANKYALRGETLIDLESGSIGGNFKADFNNANPLFLQHAKKLWNKYKKPKWSE